MLRSVKLESNSPKVQLFENLDGLLTYAQMSEWLGLSKSTLEKYVHRRQIPFVRLNAKTIRFQVDDIRNWLRSKRKGVKNG